MSEPKIPGGYIILSRKIIESEIWEKPPLYLKVWLYLLARAQHSDFKKLKRGQLRTSIPEIQEACSWKVGFRKEKPSKDQIYQILDWMRKTGSRNRDEAGYESNTEAPMITTTKATHGLIITIENYEFYQNPKNYESNDENKNETDTRATREQREPNNINKNEKNDIDKTTSPDGHDDPDSLNNKQLIIELVSMYRQIEKITPKKGDYSFIGKLYNDYGYDIVYSAIQRLVRKLAKDNVRDSLLYLKSICQKLDEEARRPNMGVVIPYRPEIRQEPVRVNMPTPEDLERQRQVEEEMWRIREEKRRKRQTGGMVNGA